VSALEDGKADGVATSNWFIARQDPRKCVYPLCGGLWVRKVNQEETVCADGKKAAECYVPSASYSKVRFDEGEAAYFGARLASGQALVRATLGTKKYGTFGHLGVLNVKEAWDALTDQEPTGSFAALAPTGIFCIQAPCPTLAEKPLNGGEPVQVTDLDLSGINAAEELKVELVNAAYEGKLVVAGALAIKEPSVTFVVSQVYTRLYHKVANDIVGGWRYQADDKSRYTYTFNADGTFSALQEPGCLFKKPMCAVKLALLGGTWSPNQEGTSLHLEYTTEIRKGEVADFAITYPYGTMRLTGQDFGRSLKLAKQP
jgi:hypothetical protein